MSTLAGHAVVVTGAGRGLGRAYAIAAARHGAGVVVNDVDAGEAAQVAAAIIDAGGAAVASHHSVTDIVQVEAMFDLCEREFSGCTGLVNNAGLIRQGPPWEVTPDDVSALLSVNVLGVLNCGHAALRRFMVQGTGVIINVTSGAHQGMKDLALYGATKGAVASATYGWAIDAAPHGVRVVGISPLGRTRMGNDSPALPDPARIAPLVVHLLGDGSRGLSGQIVRFDGETISVLGRPRLEEPLITRDDWTLAELDRAFDEQLRVCATPVGLAALDLSAI